MAEVSPPAIAGISDPSQARVLLYQAGRTVHAPLDNVGLMTDAEAADTYLPLVGGTITGDLAVDGGMTIGGDIARASLWETIAILSITSPVASIAFTDLGAYRQLRLTGLLHVGTTGDMPLLRISMNNGSSYLIGASEYWSLYEVVTGAGWASATLTATYFPFLAVSGMDSAYPFVFDLQIENWNVAAANAFMQGRTFWVDATGDTAHGMFSGGHATAGARNAFQILPITSSLSSGICHLEGVRG